MTSLLINRRAVLRAGLLAALPVAGLTRGYAQGSAVMKLRVSFNDQTMTATLDDNPSTRDLVSLLPLHDLSLDDFSNNEKVTDLPRKLTGEGSHPFDNERPGDLCYYAPWGNLAFFYANYRWSSGLIRLARFNGDLTPLKARGKFPLRIDSIS